MKIHTTEALMKAEISRRSLMKTSALVTGSFKPSGLFPPALQK